MRITSAFWYIVGFLAFFVVIFIAVEYGVDLMSKQTVQFIVDYAGVVFLIVVGGPIVYILLSVVSAGASENADGIFEIFIDSNDKDIHVFAYNRVITKSSGGATRLIQHYFMVADTGKSYYKVLFSHNMDSRNNGVMVGFESFSKSVLQGPQLKDRFKELSKETGITPDLSYILRKDENDLYKIGDHRILMIDEVSKLFRKRLTVVYTDADSQKVLWKNKL